MELKRKLEITEDEIVETRKNLRGVIRKLNNLKHHKEIDFISKEELIRLEELDDLLMELEHKINERIVFDI